MKKFYIKPLVAAIALTAAGQGYAQEAGADNTLEEVVVTGFRASLANALDTKRDSVGAVDAIYADDIADFPDTNLAESLQRIPGVAISREAGEGRQISVRGLGPDFTRVRINGMEAMSTTGGTDSAGGTNRGRGFDFNTFASELFSSLVVHKTASADLDEGSLGAIVDLNTARPLSYEDNFTLAANVKADYNDLSGETDPRVSALIAGQNESGTFGWALSVASSERNTLETGTSTVRWRDERNFGSCSGCADADAEAMVNNAHYPRIPRIDKFTHTQERTGITGTLQFKPTDVTEFTLDYLQSNTDSTRQEEFLELSIKESYNAPNADVTDYTLVNVNGERVTNVLTALSLDNVRPRIENRLDVMETKFSQLSLQGSHEFTDRFRINGILGSSKSDYDNPIQTTIIYDAKLNDNGTPADTSDDRYVNGYSYDYGTVDGRSPTISYGDLGVRDVADWEFTQARQRPNAVENSFTNFGLNAEYDLNNAFSIEGGISFKEYNFKADELRMRDNDVKDAIVDGTAIGSSLPVTADMVTITTAEGVDVGEGTDVSWISPIIDVNTAMIDLYNQEMWDRNKVHQDVTESNFGYFFQLNWDGELEGMPFRGNIGFRTVKTDLTSEGVADVPNGYVDVNDNGVFDDGIDTLNESVREDVVVERSYTKTLPSVNVSLEPMEDVVVRFGFAEVMSRPTLGSLTPGGNIDTFNAKVSYQNPFLEPFAATTMDLAVEWYFAEESQIAVAWFRKNISSFITNSSTTAPYSSLGLPASYLTGTNYSVDDQFDVTRKINGEGGTAEGYEIIYQQHFSNLPGILSNTGVQTNFTFIESEMNYAAPGEDPVLRPMNGQSDNTYSLTGYYEDEKLTARVSVVNRSDYLTNATGQSYLTEEGVKGSTNVDLSVSYQITEQFKVSLEGINLTDVAYDQYVDENDMTYVYHRTGTQWALGAQYKF